MLRCRIREIQGYVGDEASSAEGDDDGAAGYGVGNKPRSPSHSTRSPHPAAVPASPSQYSGGNATIRANVYLSS